MEATVALAEWPAQSTKDCLVFFADVGLMVMAQMLEAEMTARVGAQHAKIPGREKRTGMAPPPTDPSVVL